MQSRRCALTEAHTGAVALATFTSILEGVNLSEAGAEKSHSSRVAETLFLLMLIIVVGLAMLCVFANLRRFRCGDAEKVVVIPATSPTPSAQ
jgi:hypothetical protein